MKKAILPGLILGLALTVLFALMEAADNSEYYYRIENAASPQMVSRVLGELRQDKPKLYKEILPIGQARIADLKHEMAVKIKGNKGLLSLEGSERIVQLAKKDSPLQKEASRRYDELRHQRAEDLFKSLAAADDLRGALQEIIRDSLPGSKLKKRAENDSRFLNRRLAEKKLNEAITPKDFYAVFTYYAREFPEIGEKARWKFFALQAEAISQMSFEVFEKLYPQRVNVLVNLSDDDRKFLGQFDRRLVRSLMHMLNRAFDVHFCW